MQKLDYHLKLKSEDFLGICPTEVSFGLLSCTHHFVTVLTAIGNNGHRFRTQDFRLQGEGGQVVAVGVIERNKTKPQNTLREFESPLTPPLNPALRFIIGLPLVQSK